MKFHIVYSDDGLSIEEMTATEDMTEYFDVTHEDAIVLLLSKVVQELKTLNKKNRK